jgi:hypothetical protein
LSRSLPKMPPKSIKKRAAEASRKAQLAAAAKQPKLTPRSRRPTVQFTQYETAEALDLTVDNPVTHALPKASKVPLTYILVWRITTINAAGEEKELRSKTDLVEPASFDYHEFCGDAIRLAVSKLGNSRALHGVYTYRIHRQSPQGKLEFKGEIGDPDEFASAEGVLVKMASNVKSTWCLVLTA